MANFRHIALISPDPPKLFAFYNRLFGVEQVRVSPTGSIHVIDGLFNLAFLHQQTVSSEVVNTHRADGQEIDQTPGIAHFGFSVDKLEDVIGKLDESVQMSESPQNGRPAELRIIDPWGNNVDVSSRGYLGREEKRPTGVRYACVQTSNPSAMCEFYKNIFGITETSKPGGGTVLTDGYMALEITGERTIGKDGIQYYGVQVDDWEQLRTRLREFGQELPDDEGQEVMLVDPEGNPFAVSSRGWLA
jgi:catechol 2,3-dioxygenase-like lactoylglutathione lyase family enzyme